MASIEIIPVIQEGGEHSFDDFRNDTKLYLANLNQLLLSPVINDLVDSISQPWNSTQSLRCLPLERKKLGKSLPASLTLCQTWTIWR